MTVGSLGLGVSRGRGACLAAAATWCCWVDGGAAGLMTGEGG